MIKSRKKEEANTTTTDLEQDFPVVSEKRIEEINLNRIVVASIGILIFELINLFLPLFWEQLILKIGAVYLTVVALCFLFVILVLKKNSGFRHPDRLHMLFWVLLSIGFFPFLLKDANSYDAPVNCVLLAALLICAPLLKVEHLRIIFGMAVLVNLCAAFFADHVTYYYYIEVVVITVVAYGLARNLHGRYFQLLEEQHRHYDAHLKAQLERRALEAQLEEEQLANAAKSDFLNRMSHDIRTPMNAIIGLNDLAQEKNRDPEVDDYLKKMEQSSRFLLGLINDILDMSKIESGQMELHMEPFPLEEFKAGVDTVIRPLMEEKNIEFNFVVKSNIDCILTDKLRYNQIFFNLLSNSAKFTPSGGHVDYITELLEKQGSKVGLRTCIRDNGIGMSEEFLSHVFEPFSQENTKLNAERKGSGLGMPIAKNIVDAMGGTMTVYSKPGEGTEFLVDLWAEEVQQDQNAVQPQDGINLTGRKILLVDDNALNSMISQHLLEKQGCEVATAENGQEAIDQFAAAAGGTFDAILMDICMPIMDGLAASKAIRELDHVDADTIPIIAMTANAYEEDRKKSQKAGMNAHLAKPIETKKLYETLARHIGKRDNFKTPLVND